MLKAGSKCKIVYKQTKQTKQPGKREQHEKHQTYIHIGQDLTKNNETQGFKYTGANKLNKLTRQTCRGGFSK